MFDLSGKVAVVTGGNRGIGLALALALAEAGADVIPIGRTAERNEMAACDIQRIGRKTLPITADVTKMSDVVSALEKIVASFGVPHILVNCAGVNVKKEFLELTEDEWDLVLSTNLKSIFLCCKVIGGEMARLRRGKVINIASMGSYVGISRSAAYCASKGGVSQLTKVLAIEWAPYNVQVNAIAPGFFRTDLTRPLYLDPQGNKKVLSRTPMGRWGVPEDLRGAVVFLASSAADFVTGTILPVDGGFLAYGI